MPWVEWVGYGGSAFIALSVTMDNIKWLRLLSLAGAVLFVGYAAVLSLWPIFAVNLFIAGVNVYHLLKIRFAWDYFTLNETLRGHEFFIKQFLSFYRDDIEKVRPGFDLEAIPEPRLIVILRNLNPVGLFVYTVEDERVLRIHLDYATPDYRDMKNARVLLHRKIQDFRRDGYLQFITEADTPQHRKYLERLGFVADEDGRAFRRAV